MPKYKPGCIIAGADWNYTFRVIRFARDRYGDFHYELETLSYRKEVLSKRGDRELYLCSMVDEGSHLVRDLVNFNTIWNQLNG